MPRFVERVQCFQWSTTGRNSVTIVVYSVYYNDLLVQLSHSGYGCSIGRCCVGAVGYADDICIMSASASGLQSLLDICFAFAESNDLMFNHKKTKCMRFVTGACRWMCHLPVPELFLGDSIVEFVDQCTHLGHVIQSDLGHASAIDAELKRFFLSFNSFSMSLEEPVHSSFVVYSRLIRQRFMVVSFGARTNANKCWMEQCSQTNLWCR